MTDQCRHCGSATCPRLLWSQYPDWEKSDLEAACVRNQLAAAKTDNERLKEQHDRYKAHLTAMCGEATGRAIEAYEWWKAEPSDNTQFRYFTECRYANGVAHAHLALCMIEQGIVPKGVEQREAFRVYRLHDGNSESVTGTLTVGEGGILLARNRWESSDLEAAAALEPGQKVQLADDGFWIERVE